MAEVRKNPVVVGIDGSADSLGAATWAARETILRGGPLRLVYVSPEKPNGRASDPEAAESALSLAQATVQDMVKAIEVDTAIRRGRPDCVLIAESRGAALMCVGSGGRGRFVQKALGPTAAALAKHAHCPVAIIRTDGAPHAAGGWIAAVQNDDADNDAVVRRAMEEGRLRRAPVLLIDRRRDSFVRRYPDVHVQTVAARPGAMRSIEGGGNAIQLVVAGVSAANHVARLQSPDYDPVLGYDDCSILLLRN